MVWGCVHVARVHQRALGLAASRVSGGYWGRLQWQHAEISSASRCARGPEVEAPISVLLTVLALVLLWSCSNFHFCRSVARCEALVKKQYSFLGWEYTEPDSGDDQKATGGEVSSIKEKPHGGVLPHGWEHTGGKVTPDRQPVVLLSRLPPCELSSLSLPASQIPGRGHESSKTSDEDELQETDDSDVSVSSFITLHKRRKREQKDEKLDTSPSTGSEGTGAVGSVQNKAGIKHKERKMMKVTTRPASNKGTVLTSEKGTPLFQNLGLIY